MFLDVIEVHDKIREIKNKCQSLKFDSINTAFKHGILPQNIIDQTKECDENTVYKDKYGELEKQTLNH